MFLGRFCTPLAAVQVSANLSAFPASLAAHRRHDSRYATPRRPGHGRKSSACLVQWNVAPNSIINNSIENWTQTPSSVMIPTHSILKFYLWKTPSFSAIHFGEWKSSTHLSTKHFPQASHRMTREKCSTKGAKAGCKAKDSWLRLRVWSLLQSLLFATQRREFNKKRNWNMGEMWWSPRWFCSKKKHGNYFTAWWEQTISILLTPTKLWRHFPLHILRVLDQATANRSLTQQSWKEEPYNPWYFARSQPFPEKIWVLSTVESYALSWDVWKGLHLASDTSMLKLILMHNGNRRPQMEKTKSLLLPVKRSTVSTRLTNHINCRHVGPATSFTFSASEIVTYTDWIR